MTVLTANNVVFDTKLYVCNRRYNKQRIIKQLCFVTGAMIDSSDPHKATATVKFLDGTAGRIFVSVVDNEVVFVDGGGKPSLLEATSKFKVVELAKRKNALIAAQVEYNEVYNALAEDI